MAEEESVKRQKEYEKKWDVSFKTSTGWLNRRIEFSNCL